jgi:flagellar assembly protein FliH
MRRSRVIGKDQAPAAGRWDFPSVDATAGDALRGAVKGGAHLLTAGQVQALEREVKEEARRRGYEEGLAAGKAELTARLARLDALAAAFAHPFQGLERAVEDEVVGLAIELARHLLRHEIVADTKLLQTAVADCLAVLAADVRDITIYFNPEDAALLRNDLSWVERRFEVASDPELRRGDLRLTSASSLVDGSLVTRCREIIAAARAGEPRPEPR